MFICKSRPPLRLGLLACLAMAFWTPVFGETLEELEAKAEKGDAQAQSKLGGLYHIGYESIEKNPKKAFDLWQQAADQGDATAQNNLAFCYIDGIAVAKNPKKAFELWLNAAEQGDASAVE